MGILSGITVLDLSRILSGPYITMCLGDMGAEIIKIEEPKKGDDTRTWGPPFAGQDSAYYLAINRNKRSVAVNLKHPDGLHIVHDLARTADVVVANFRPGAAERLGVDYATLSQLNERLVMLNISAFGTAGPLRDRAGYDLLAQAMGGLMSLTGAEDGPPVKAGFAIADLGAAMFGLSGILAALYHRALTGQGQYLCTSLYETQLAYHINWAGNYFLTGEVPGALGSAHPNLAPYQAYAAADGHFIIAVGNDHLFARLCSAVGAPHLIEDPRFATNALRVQNRRALESELAPALGGRTVDAWCQTLEAAGVPAGPIQNLGQIYESEQTAALGLVQEVEHPVAGRLRQVGFPVQFGAQPAAMRLPPPLLGEHTDEVLLSLGRTPEEIGRLRAEGAIG